MGIGPMHTPSTPIFLLVEKLKLFSYTYASKGLLADIIVIKTVTNFIAIIVRILKLSVGPGLGEIFNDQQ